MQVWNRFFFSTLYIIMSEKLYIIGTCQIPEPPFLPMSKNAWKFGNL